MCTKNIVIERTRDLIYLKFVATDVFPKLISPVLVKTPVICPCYSAVSALLTNPLPDLSNYSPPLPHPLPHSPDQYLTSSLFGPDPLPSRSAGDLLHCCSTVLQNLVGNSGETQCLVKAEQQADASVNVPYPPL